LTTYEKVLAFWNKIALAHRFFCLGFTMSRSDDIFDVTFDCLLRSLTSNDKKQSKRVVEDSNAEAMLQSILLSEVLRKSTEHKKELAASRVVLLEKYKSNVKLVSNATAQLEGSHKLNVAVSKQYEHVMMRRLATQKNSSEKRMRDLVFEVIGEYGKSNIRILRRQQYLRKTGRTKIVLAVWTMNWQKFALRLKYDLCQSIMAARAADSSAFAATWNVVHCAHLDPHRHKEELEYVIKKLTKKIGLVSEKKLIVQSVVRVSKHGKDKSLTQTAVRMATNTKEFYDILHCLSAWVSKGIVLPAGSASGAGSGAAGSGVGGARPPLGSPAGALRGGVASRGKSAGTSRPRPGTASASGAAGAGAGAGASALQRSPPPLLKDLLSAAPIEWMQPAAYLHAQWSQLFDPAASASASASASGNADDAQQFQQYHHHHHHHQQQLSEPNGSGGACGGNCDDEEVGAFTRFVQQYHAQHTSALWSDRVYFCLEERSLALVVAEQQQQGQGQGQGQGQHFASGSASATDSNSNSSTGRPMSPDSALLAILGDNAEASKEEKRIALENAITVQLQLTLQVFTNVWYFCMLMVVDGYLFRMVDIVYED
jgi:hypothetical protein